MESMQYNRPFVIIYCLGLYVSFAVTEPKLIPRLLTPTPDPSPRGEGIKDFSPRHFVIFVFFLIMVFTANSLFAAQWKAEPTISLQAVYDDNILFKDESDFESRLTPGIDLSRHTGRLKVDLSGYLDIIRYLDNSQYDRENQDYRIRAEYAASPKLSINVLSRAIIDYTFDEYWEEEGIFTETGKRHAYTISPGLYLALDEKTALEINVFYNMVNYSQEFNPDYDVLGASMSISRAVLDGRTVLFALTGFQWAVYDLDYEESEQRVYRLMMGAKRRFTESLDLSLSVGPMWIESRFDGLFFNIKEDDLSYAADCALNWRMERTRLNLRLERSENQSTYGENVTRNRVTTRIVHDLSSRWRATMRGSFTQNETEGFVRKRKNESVNLNIGFIYVFTENTDIRMGYNYRRNENKITDKTDKGNRVYLMYSWSFPKVW